MISRCLIRKPEAGQWLQLTAPVQTLVATKLEHVVPMLNQVETRVEEQTLTAVGFICYEAAAAFDSALQTHSRGVLPLAVFALFESAEILSETELPWQTPAETASWELAGCKNQYLKNIAAIREKISQGNVYQINYTLPLQAAGVAAWPLFSQIAPDAEYAALIEADDFAIVSASPELFFKLDGSMLRCEPMKGTAARGLSAQADQAQAEWLAASPKNQAENLMITDMVRNDLGRIAQAGSVTTSDLFKVAPHPTVWQMTSSVTCETNASITEILTHLFPGASITGAPKNASMALIRSLEPQSREIYTGTIGLLEPGRTAQFNIAIRTAWIDHQRDTAHYHAGGGIVWDSEAEAEFEELMAKTRILKRSTQARSFELLETLLWQPHKGYYLLEEHLQRLSGSARYWGFRCDAEAVRDQLMEYSRTLASQPARIRLLADRAGAIRIEHAPLPPTASVPVRLMIYPEAIDPEDPLLYHKTTARRIYDRALSWAPPGCEALLQNPDGFVTESPIANLIYQIDGNRYTPPVACGLLSGTLRQTLLTEGKISERSLRRDELASCDGLWLINSLRGWREAVFSGDSAD